MEPEKTQSNPEANSSVPPAPVKAETVPAMASEQKLPGVFALLSEGFSFARDRVDLVALMLASSALLYLLFEEGGEGLFALSFLSPVAYVGLLVFAFVGYFLTTLALVLAVTTTDQRQSLSTLIRSTPALILPFLWVATLTGFAVMGGFMIFIIPGIIISGYLSFIYFTLVRENKRGLEALMRSHELVEGKWWGVVLRIMGVYILLAFMSFALAFIVSMVIKVLPIGPAGVMSSTDLWFSIMSSVSGVVAIRSLMVLYEARAAVVPVAEPKNRGLYLTFTIIGVFITAAMIALLIFLFASDSSVIDSYEVTNQDWLENKEATRELRDVNLEEFKALPESEAVLNMEGEVTEQ